MSDLGNRVYHLRQRYDMSQQQLAALCQTSATYIGRLERGELPNPTLRILAKLADALHTTPANLIR